MYGVGFTNFTEVVFTSSEGEFGKECKFDTFHIKTKPYTLTEVSEDGTMAKLTVTAGDLKFIDGMERDFERSFYLFFFFERELALLVALQGESIWKGCCCWGDIKLRRQKKKDKATQTWIQALVTVAEA